MVFIQFFVHQFVVCASRCMTCFGSPTSSMPETSQISFLDNLFQFLQCCLLPDLLYAFMLYRFFTGPGIAPQSIPTDCSNAVLILNGREASKVSAARKWLDYIVEHSSQFSNVAVVLLGNEQCNNSWIMKYMSQFGGPVKAAFVVYDLPDVDDDVFHQWPLGVAT